jgi:hypothetical protein
LAVVAMLGLACDFAQAGGKMTKEILAVQIRKQGFVCDKPESFERDAEHSKPHDAVWMLRCENGNYRVRLVPKMAAEVEQVR